MRLTSTHKQSHKQVNFTWDKLPYMSSAEVGSLKFVLMSSDVDSARCIDIKSSTAVLREWVIFKECRKKYNSVSFSFWILCTTHSSRSSKSIFLSGLQNVIMHHWGRSHRYLCSYCFGDRSWCGQSFSLVYRCLPITSGHYSCQWMWTRAFAVDYFRLSNNTSGVLKSRSIYGSWMMHEWLVFFSVLDDISLLAEGLVSVRQSGLGADSIPAVLSQQRLNEVKLLCCTRWMLQKKKSKQAKQRLSSSVVQSDLVHCRCCTLSMSLWLVLGGARHPFGRDC